jgi:hypothetical protein
LIGGFSKSPSLRKFLLKEMVLFNDSHNTAVHLDDSASFTRLETAMAHGAVLRALDEEDELLRNSRSSYGFTTMEELNRDLEAHKNVKPHYDKVDGMAYVKNVINWTIKKVTFVTALELCPGSNI